MKKPTKIRVFEAWCVFSLFFSFKIHNLCGHWLVISFNLCGFLGSGSHYESHQKAEHNKSLHACLFLNHSAFD